MSDWDSVTVIGKRATTNKQLKSTSAINQASRQGGQIVSEKKTGLNQARSSLVDKGCLTLMIRYTERVNSQVYGRKQDCQTGQID